jgi:hypothetical protein
MNLRSAQFSHSFFIRIDNLVLFSEGSHLATNVGCGLLVEHLPVRPHHPLAGHHEQADLSRRPYRLSDWLARPEAPHLRLSIEVGGNAVQTSWFPVSRGNASSNTYNLNHIPYHQAADTL